MFTGVFPYLCPHLFHVIPGGDHDDGEVLPKWEGSFGISHSQSFNSIVPWELELLSFFWQRAGKQVQSLLIAHGERQS